MTDNADKKSDQSNNLTNDVLIADMMLRITSMEKLLMEKNVFTQEELQKTTTDIAEKVAAVMIEKAKAAKNLPNFIADLESNKHKMDN
jgi:hypothetical protein